MSAASIVEQIAHIHVGHVPHGHHVREADPVRGGPVEHAAHERAGLGEKGELAGRRLAEAEIGIEAERRHGDAETVRPDDAQAIRAAPRSSIACRISGPSPAVMTTAARVPLAPNAPISAGMVAGGAAITASSGASGNAVDIGEAF